MLKEVRHEVADLLNAGLAGAAWEAHPNNPERPQPNSVYVVKADNWLESMGTFGNQYTNRLEVIAIAPKGTNEVMEDALDDVVELILPALPDWRLESISEPYIVVASNAEYLAVRVTVTASVTL